MSARKAMVVALSLIILFGIAPILSLLTAACIANANGCQLDEGSVHPCVLLGIDFGDVLYAMGVLGWMTLMTVPLAALAFGVWLIAAIVLYIVYRRRRAV